ncbi:hypothetical protein J5Y09_09870 [Roseomonas sp. PWR1]|uniref:Uncharacterized protein n=1 Tax=Roseomonas nitratireducens TaxID=2820810 RepID=A0ABS4ASJ9_9PROT|nr:hypothetical protein [Neoroseomonas nitratireducens]MBP0464219.1 hypothetical protein [Neoroseomonas nitratireducens]
MESFDTVRPNAPEPVTARKNMTKADNSTGEPFAPLAYPFAPPGAASVGHGGHKPAPVVEMA